MKTNRVYVGLAWDEYTPAVQAQLVRDVMALKEKTNKWPGSKLVVVSPKPDADAVLVQLGVPRVPNRALATFWRVYEVLTEPDLPDNAETISICKVTQKTTPAPLRLNRWGGFMLQEQGRPYGDTSLINRPAPNGYAPVSPALVSIWT